ncbi:MAG: O-antigen ligase family protein [Armatimonadetes bacterium]|nr:O-antigen ligase family protein [Armatimonadota bacterium]
MATAAGYNSIRRLDPLYIIMGFGGVLLLTNKIPALAIAATLVTVYLGISAWLMSGRILSICGKPFALLGCMYTYLLISYFASGQPASGLVSYDFLKEDGNFFFAYAMFFAFVASNLNYRSLFSVYHTLVLLAFSFAAVLGVIEIALGKPGLVSSYYQGEFYFSALNKSHNATGSVYAAACIVALSAWLFRSKTQKTKWHYLLALLCCLLGLLITKSRGSILSFALAAAFLFYKRYGPWFIAKRQFISLITAVTIAAIFTGAHVRWIHAVNYPSDTNIVDRVTKWQNAWLLFTLSPAIGVGFGRYNDICPPLTVIDPPLLDGIPGLASLCTNATPVYDSSHAHNSYLQFLAETGILGLGLLLWFWHSIYVRLSRAFKITQDESIRTASVQGMSNIILLLILSLTENYLSATTVMLFMSSSIGISLGLIGRSDAARER